MDDYYTAPTGQKKTMIIMMMMVTNIITIFDFFKFELDLIIIIEMKNGHCKIDQN